MKTHEILGQLSQMHQMMAHLFESVPEADGYRRFAPDIPPLAWLFGRAVYIETYWIREILQGDEGMTARVRHLFGAGVTADERVTGQLPPREHLLNWALELQDDHLMRLANPGLLPADPRLASGRIPLLILQEYGRNYELALAQLTARRLQEPLSYRVEMPLRSLPPSEAHVDVHKGMFRIGARDEDAAARDNELPAQVVELDAFRIDTGPVSNGAYLGFMEAGGYDNPDLWSEAGNAWRADRPAHPIHWRQDEADEWFGVGLNGPFDLAPEEPVGGITLHEAQAYANWVASLGGPLAGAVLQHEYQWEVAVRSRAITDRGRVWEWCANPFHAYSGYKPPAEAEAASVFDDRHHTLRGGSLHTQSALRRTSYRHHARPEEPWHFSGMRLVFPPSDMPWHTD